MHHYVHSVHGDFGDCCTIWPSGVNICFWNLQKLYLKLKGVTLALVIGLWTRRLWFWHWCFALEKKPTCSALNWKVWVKPLIIYLPAWCTFHSYASKWAFYWILLQDRKFWQETVENEWSQLHFGYMDYCHSNMLLLILKSLDDCVSMETAGWK